MVVLSSKVSPLRTRTNASSPLNSTFRRVLSARSSSYITRYRKRFSPRRNGCTWRHHRPFSSPRSNGSNWRNKRSFSTFSNKYKRRYRRPLSHTTTEQDAQLTEHSTCRLTRAERFLERRKRREQRTTRSRSCESFSKTRQRLFDSLSTTTHWRCDSTNTTRRMHTDCLSTTGNSCDSLTKMRKNIFVKLNVIRQTRFGGATANRQSSNSLRTARPRPVRRRMAAQNGLKQVTIDEHQNKVFHYEVTPTASAQSAWLVKSFVGKNVEQNCNENLEKLENRWNQCRSPRLEEPPAFRGFTNSADRTCIQVRRISTDCNVPSFNSWPRDNFTFSYNDGGDSKGSVLQDSVPTLPLRRKRNFSPSSKDGSKKVPQEDLKNSNGKSVKPSLNEKYFVTDNELPKQRPQKKLSFPWNLLNQIDKLQQKENYPKRQDVSNVVPTEKYCNDKNNINHEPVATPQLARKCIFRQPPTPSVHRDAVDKEDVEKEVVHEEKVGRKEKCIQTSCHSPKVQKKSILANLVTAFISDGFKENVGSRPKTTFKITIRRKGKNDRRPQVCSCQQKNPRRHHEQANALYGQQRHGLHTIQEAKMDWAKAPRPDSQPRLPDIKQVKFKETTSCFCSEDKSSEREIEFDVIANNQGSQIKRAGNKNNFLANLPLSLHHPYKRTGDFFSYNTGFMTETRPDSANIVFPRNIFIQDKQSTFQIRNATEVDCKSQRPTYSARSGTTVHSNSMSFVTFKLCERKLTEECPYPRKAISPPSFSMNVASSGFSLVSIGANTRQGQCFTNGQG